jgi:hypothetical protein
MILSAPLLTNLQRCPRLAILNEGQAERRWYPKVLFDRCLRAGILSLSQGNGNATGFAVEMFLKAAKSPGLDTGRDPFTIAQDYIAMLQTILEAISRETILALKPGPSIIIDTDLIWTCVCFQDDTGTLHRWATIDKIEEPAPSSELHSWYVSGDMLAARVPMVLHLIEIGNQRHGHQHTPWCKAYKHPAVAGRFAFQKQDGRPLQGDWKPVWFQDSTANNAKDWVDMMERDNVRLIRHLQLKQASEKLCARNVEHVRQEAARLEALPEDYRELPIFRPACDKPYACQWQWKCYGVEG